MKGTPKKSKAGIGDTTSIDNAIKSANEYSAMSARKTARPENEKTNFVNIRLKETEYKRIAHLAVEAGIDKAKFCKQAALYIAEMVEAGAYSINGGNVLDRRGL
jgi:hypothetical protein